MADASLMSAAARQVVRTFDIEDNGFTGVFPQWLVQVMAASAVPLVAELDVRCPPGHAGLLLCTCFKGLDVHRRSTAWACAWLQSQILCKCWHGCRALQLRCKHRPYKLSWWLGSAKACANLQLHMRCCDTSR